MQRSKKMIGTNVKSVKAIRLSGMLALAVAGLVVPRAFGDAVWTGATDSNWDNLSNWSATPTGNLEINFTTNPGIYPIVSSTPTNVAPTDIRIGTGGQDGRVDVTAGTLGTGNGNWLFVGYQGGQATLNIANTAATGGTLTGFGQGSGGFNAGGASQNGNMLIGLDANTRATVNINTTGTVAGAGMFLGANGASTGTVNLDSGNIVLSGEMQVGSNFFGNGGTGTLNMSGGTITADIFGLARGGNNAAAITGTANITGGTINSKRWFTLGFAGTASNTAIVNNNGGTININTNSGGPGVLEMGVFDATTNTFNAQSGSVNLQNNASIVFGNGGNHTGTSTFNQNGGNVTFYGDSGTTVGGTGSINLGNGNSSGTYVYNLNGGTLTVPQIRKSGVNANGSFNFNGGTLVAAADSTAFLSGLTNATVQSGGATINTNGHNVTVGQNLNGSGNVTKTGTGTLTLANAQDYTGTTTVSAGNLKLTPNFNYNTSSTTVASGATLSTGSVAGNTILAGSLTQNSGGAIDLRNGVADTLSISNGLTLGGGSLGFDVGSTADAISLTGGTFSLSGTNNVFLANLGGATSGATYSLLTGATGLTLSNFSLQTPTVAGYAASLSVVGGSTLQLTLGSATAALAAYYNVNGNAAFAPASFSAAANGTGTVNAIGAATAVTFSSTPVSNSTAKTVTLGGDQSVKSITISDTAAVTLAGASTLTIADSAGITVNSGAGAFSVNTAGVALDANQTWTNNSASVTTVAAVISGTGRSLSFAGPGTFVLTGASTYSGATTVGGGTTLQLGDGTAGHDGSIAGTTGVSNSGSLVYNRNGTSNTAGYVISGEGTVTVNGNGSQAFTAVNTYTGGTTVNGAKVVINGVNSLGDEVGSLNLNSGTLQTTANINSVRLINISGANSTIETNATTTFTVSNAINGDATLYKTGAGTLRVNYPSGYTGGTVVSAGTFQIAGDNIPGGPITLNGGTLAADNAGGQQYEPTITNPIAVGANGGTIAIPAGTFTHLNGPITGSGPLTVGGLFNGSGLGLEGDISAYTGTVTVVNANTRLGNLAASSGTIPWVVNGNLQTNVVGGGTFNFGSISGTGSIVGHANNPSTAVSTIRVGALNTSTTFSGLIADAPANNAATGNVDNAANNVLALTKVGTGTFTITGANTYTGVTTVTAGTLKASGGAVTNVLTNAGGLDLQSTGQVVLDYTGGASPVAQVKSILDAGYSGGFASGQIRSSTLPAGQTIGYGDNGADSVMLRLTLPGDANLDGAVNFNDFLVLQNNFGQADTRFDQGNFNFDGFTNFNDFLILQNNFGQSVTGASVVVSREEVAALTAFANSGGAVPEPASLALLGLSAVGLLRRRVK